MLRCRSVSLESAKGGGFEGRYVCRRPAWAILPGPRSESVTLESRAGGIHVCSHGRAFRDSIMALLAAELSLLGVEVYGRR